jgi:5-methylcytosine-specific restriction endonuclease McrA
MQVCSACKIEKQFSLFFKSKNKKNGIGNQCKECVKKYNIKNKEAISNNNKNRRDKNKEKAAEYAKKYRELNKDKIRKQKAKYRESKKEDRAKYNSIYYKTPIGKASKQYNRMRRRVNKRGDVTVNQIENLQKVSKTCYWCGINLKNVTQHIDHYVPLSKGGKHTISNLVVAYENCNLSKYNKDPLVFAQQIGKLF